jgi:NAD(P)-dependent dehydrogenase (short-subunit alcohol dehydrogenase family)
MPQDLFDLSGCVAVVLGATSGIGRALAVGLAGAGADVVPAGRRSALVDEAAREIEQLGRRMLAQACDVRSRESIDRLCDAVLEKFGRADILLNAAGQIFRKPTQRIGEAEWDALMDVNVTGILRACQSFYGPLAASGHGRVINIASLNSFVALAEVAACAASKGAVLSLTRSLAVEWAPRGISVNAIATGDISPQMTGTLGSRNREALWPGSLS